MKNLKRWLISIKKARQEIKNVFHFNKHYLKAGKYKYNPNFKVFYNKQADKSLFPKDIFVGQRKRMLFSKSLKRTLGNFSFDLAKLTTKTSVVKSTQGSAELVFFTRGENGAKIFDFEKQIVISVFSDKNDFNLTLKNHKSISDYFNTAVTHIDKYSMTITENLFDYKEPKDININDLDLINDYIKDLTNLHENKTANQTVNLRHEFHNFFKNNYFNEFHNLLESFINLDSISNINIGVYNFKRDMGIGNILFNHTTYTVIDYATFNNVSTFQLFITLLNGLEEKTSIDAYKLFFDGYFDEIVKRYLGVSDLIDLDKKTLLILPTVYRMNQMFSKKGNIPEKKLNAFYNRFSYIENL